MADDVVYNKIAIIERCLQRIHEEYQESQENLRNYTKQDSIILNIQRACEASIDLAMHIVALKGLGIPQNSRDAFDMLVSHGIIDAAPAQRLKGMVGFRNVAVHNYQVVDLAIVQGVIEHNLQDLVDFGRIVLTKLG